MGVVEFKARVLELTGGSSSAFKRSALNIRDGAGVLDKILGSGRFDTVLEIGTYKGVTAAYMAGLCKQVITIDLVQGRLEQVGESFDRQRLWADLGLSNIELHLVTNNRAKADLISRLDFDLAFIDGAKYDVAQDFVSVKRCGAVLFHDYDRREGPNQNAVFDFVNTLPEQEVQVMDIFAFWERKWTD